MRGGAAAPTGPKPSQKMKGLHWNKLRGNQIDKTLFKDLDPNVVKIDYSALENLFCQKTVSKDEGAEGGKKKLQVVAKVTFINGKTLQAVGIFLKQFGGSKDIKAILEARKVDVGRLVRDSVFSLDKVVLDADRINALLQGAPDPAEVDQIKQWAAADPENTLDKLNEVDQYFLVISEVNFFCGTFENMEVYS